MERIKRYFPKLNLIRKCSDSQKVYPTIFPVTPYDISEKYVSTYKNK